MPRERRAAEACAHIAGMDIHPVAVIIGRVTYLLALSPALAYRAGPLSIPVYLGDAMQLSISEFMAGKELTIAVPPPPAGQQNGDSEDGNGREQLTFPETFCRDPALFDKAIEQMRIGSLDGRSHSQIEAALTRITEQHYRADLTAEQKLAIQDLGKTYLTFDQLRRDKRDTIWAYVARNLSRPLAYSASGGWANVVIGNPPWLAFRHMSTDLQKRFRALAKHERVYVGGRFATQNDLSALFSVGVAHLYLRSGGRLALVLPMAALTRGQFDQLRTGSFHSTNVAWDEVWTMDDSVQPLFPVPSCVVFGRKQAVPCAIPSTVRAYSGYLPFRDAPEEVADSKLRVIEGAPARSTGNDEEGSKYRTSFRNGATLFPRLFVFIEHKSMGLLGADPTAPAVMSRRTRQEKEPWKSAPTIEGRVEAEFLRPIVLGESILPYRVFKPFDGVVPVTASGLVLNAEAAANRGYGGLHAWMSNAEAIWEANKHSDMSLIERFDYFGLLSAQFPLASLRLVYSKAGTLPAACILKNVDFIIENLCYWAEILSDNEARYLEAILNSEAARARAAHYQARGQWGARHFDKVMFNLPIPRFDPANRLHGGLADAAAEAERVAAAVELLEGVQFRRARRLVRTALTEDGVSQRIDALVARLLDAS